MVHHIALLKLKPTLPPEKMEEIMIEIRIRLLKIPEILNLRCGKKIDSTNSTYDLHLRSGKRVDATSSTYDMFFSMDFENMHKLHIAQDSAIWFKFKQQVLDQHVDLVSAFHYEMEPGKDVRYS